MNTIVTLSLVIGSWIAGVAIIAVVSVAMDANLSTTGLLVALGIAPGIVVALLAEGAPSPAVVEILHSIETKDGRS